MFLISLSLPPSHFLPPCEMRSRGRREEDWREGHVVRMRKGQKSTTAYTTKTDRWSFPLLWVSLTLLQPLCGLCKPTSLTSRLFSWAVRAWRYSSWSFAHLQTVLANNLSSLSYLSMCVNTWSQGEVNVLTDLWNTKVKARNGVITGLGIDWFSKSH